MVVLLVILVVVALAIEVGLYWSAVAIADAPPQSPLKLLVGSLLVGAFFAAAIVVTPLVTGLSVGELINWWTPNGTRAEVWNGLGLRALLATGLSLLACWLAPALLFIPMLPSSPRKGMAISGIHLFLRVLTYALLSALILIILALLQIIRTTASSPPVGSPSVRVASAEGCTLARKSA